MKGDTVDKSPIKRHNTSHHVPRWKGEGSLLKVKGGRMVDGVPVRKKPTLTRRRKEGG